MNQFVIYTAIVGNYDEIYQPEVIDDRFDYIIFSNDINENTIGVWQIRPINYDNPIQTKIARWVKTHPDELLKEYKFSIWMDANIVIQTDYTYTKALDLYKKNINISAISHPIRKCIYEECAILLTYRLEKEDVVMNWVSFLKSNKYPYNIGLCETGVLYRVHNEHIKQFNIVWWQYIEQYSRRDQLSFNFALWQQNIECDLFMLKGRSVRDHEAYKYMKHKSQNVKYCDNNSIIIKYGETQQSVYKYYIFIIKSSYYRFTKCILSVYIITKVYIKRILKFLCPSFIWIFFRKIKYK